MAKLFANSGDPDQMPHSAESDLGLHCLPITLLWVSQLQWINFIYFQVLMHRTSQVAGEVWGHMVLILQVCVPIRTCMKILL